jgi:hypothetical protein
MSDVDILHCIHYVSFCNRDFCSCNITAYLQNKFGGNKYELFVVNENTPLVSHACETCHPMGGDLCVSVADFFLSLYEGSCGEATTLVQICGKTTKLNTKSVESKKERSEKVLCTTLKSNDA